MMIVNKVRQVLCRFENAIIHRCISKKQEYREIISSQWGGIVASATYYLGI